MKFSLIIGVLLAGLWIVGIGSTTQAGPGDGDDLDRPTNLAARIPCTKVIATINYQVHVQRGRAVDMSQVAKQLGTSVAWVERCMQAYGRRPKRPGLETSESREARMEAFEEDEPEEPGPEDSEEPGARERVEHPQKPRVLRIKPEPTPDTFFKDLTRDPAEER